MYADASSVRDARAQYFAANGFSEASYRDAWVRFKIGPFPVAFPNTASRRRAIPLHDLHHVATGYATTLIGEAEIGAWEIGGSCTDHWAAWVLNASAFAYGALLAPRRVYRAFMRGRHSRNLYRLGWQDSLLDLTVGELRDHLALAGNRAPLTWRDRAAFFLLLLLVSLPTVGAVVIGLALLRT